MKVCIFGTGYVGLVQAAALAEHGHDVMCLDVVESKIEQLKRGQIPIYERDLELFVKNNQERGTLHFDTDPAPAVSASQIIFIAVGTPPNEDGSADLRHVLGVAKQIGDLVSLNDKYLEKVVVVKSTVPIGTGDQVEAVLQSALISRGLQKDIKIHVVSNPEFLKEGQALADCMRPDRIIIGLEGEHQQVAAHLMTTLYSSFNHNKARVLIMGRRDAEMTKYTANSMLAARISFMNEMALIAEQYGVDINNVRLGIGSDQRIGSSFIYPGCGYGGSCFPKDVSALIRSAGAVGVNTQILQAIEDVNARQKRVLADKVIKHYGADLKGKTFAMWGLAFKPETDDIREAPSRTIMEILWEHGAHIQAHDFEATDNIHALYGDHPQLTLCQSKEDALNGADALILCTEWTQYRNLDHERMRDLMKQNCQLVIFDGRNIYNPELCNVNGFEYYGIGTGRSIIQK